MDHRTKDVENLLSNPHRALLSMSLPLLFALIVENLQTFVDGVWCSGLGSDALAAISLAQPIYGMIAAVGTGIGIGVSAAIAKFIGAADRESADNATVGTLMMVLVLSLVSSVVLWFASEPLIMFCGGEGPLDLCLEYIRPFLLMSFFLMMNAVWAGMLRAEGAATRSMMLSIIASVINIVLDPVMIYGLGLGVLGASLATCISFAATTAIALRWYLSGKLYVSMDFKGYRFRKATLMEVCIIGVPCIVEMAVQPMLAVPQNAIVYSCGGEEGLVAYIYSFRFIAIALIPTVAIGKSLIPIISAGIGQNDPGKIMESCRIAYRFTLIMETFFMVVILLTADILVNAFMNSESMALMHDEMALALRICSLTCIFHTFRILGTSILQATRHAVVASVLTVSREFLFIGSFMVAATISMHAIYWACDVTNFIMMFLISAFAFHYLRKLVSELEAKRPKAVETGKDPSSA